MRNIYNTIYTLYKRNVYKTIERQTLEKKVLGSSAKGLSVCVSGLSDEASIKRPQMFG